jgi:hypothetical protein
MVTINVVNCLRRPSSRAKHSSKPFTKTHNLERIEEEHVVNDELRNIKIEDDPVIDKYFKFLKNFKI